MTKAGWGERERNAVMTLVLYAINVVSVGPTLVFCVPAICLSWLNSAMLVAF